MLFRRDPGSDAAEARAARRLLSAAAARGEPAPLSPHQRTRLLAALASATAGEAHPIGAAAWRMLPALALLVTVVAGYSGYETARASRERQAAVRSLGTSGGADEALLAALVLSGGENGR